MREQEGRIKRDSEEESQGKKKGGDEEGLRV